MSPFHRKFYIGLCLCASLILSGCWDRIEVNDLAIVQGVGLDLAEDGNIEVTASIAVPARISPPGATGGGGQTGPPATNKSATGRTVSEAFTRLQEKLSRRIFWAHNSVILIGEDLAREGIASALDFYTRNRQPRLSAPLAVTVGRASDVLATTLPIELNVPIGIQETGRLQLFPFVDVLGFLRLLHREGIEPVTGLVHVVTGGAPEPGTLEMPEGPDRDPKQPAVYGAAIFNHDRLVGLLTEEEAQGLIFIRGEYRSIFVVVPLGSDDWWISFAVLRHRNRIVPKIQDGRLVIGLDIRIQADLQGNAAGVDTDDFVVIKMLEKELGKALERTIRRTLDKLQKELQVDAPGFGAAVNRDLPHVWREVRHSWREIYPTLPVEINVEASILRTGLTNRPQALTDDEIIRRDRLREILQEE